MIETIDRKFEIHEGGHPTSLEAAQAWAKRGYFVLPIPYRQKRPELSGWQKLRLTAEEIPAYFGSASMNVGLLLGEPHGISDVDLDCSEALLVWPTFAPPTGCVFGRATKQRSHYLYHADPPGPSLKFDDPIDKKTMLELRCLGKGGDVGRQTVIPFSTHKDSGESIRFESGCGPDPSNVEWGVLARAVRKCSAASLLARHYPPSGRHDTELALAGVLARAGWDEQAAMEFIVATYTAVPDHDPSAVPRVRLSVSDTFKKFAEGDECTGYTRLSSLVEKRTLDAALSWLGIERDRTAVIVDTTNWRDHLLVNMRGGIVPCVGNAMIALQHAKEWSGVLNFNESACRVEALSQPPWNTIKPVPFNWTDEDDVHAAAWMQHEGIFGPKAIAGEAIQTVAREHPFHPIRQYFDSLVWDGVPRIDVWLPTYIGAEISEYNHAVGAKFLIGAVARVFRPGCKNDCCMVLEGRQGLFKSTALRILGEPWFTDHIADLGSKDSQMQVHGVLILEIAELDGMSKSEASRIKSFMSSASDRFRPPYGKHVVDVPRESVFAGTLNDGIKYLKDETGARRFWPVKCGAINIDKLRRDKDQLWAEAVVRLKADDSWWLESVELIDDAEEEQAERYDTDPWHEKIKAFIEGRLSVAIVEILEQCIEKPTERWTQADKNRVGRCLRFLEWVEKRVGAKGVRRYFPPDRA